MAVGTSLFGDGETYQRLRGHSNRAVGEELIDWLSLPKGLKWLDVGCGCSAFTALVLESCTPSHISAIDPAKDQVSDARSRLARTYPETSHSTVSDVRKKRPGEKLSGQFQRFFTQSRPTRLTKSASGPAVVRETGGDHDNQTTERSASGLPWERNPSHDCLRGTRRCRCRLESDRNPRDRDRRSAGAGADSRDGNGSRGDLRCGQCRRAQVFGLCGQCERAGRRFG